MMAAIRNPNDDPLLGFGRQEVSWFCTRVIPGNFFGLPFYSILLLLGKIDPAIRRSILIAAVIGWVFVALVVVVMVLSAPTDATTAYVIWSVVAGGTWAAVLAGSLIYNRIHYGFYL